MRGVDTEDRSGNVLAGISSVLAEFRPDVIFHLAAAKHAPVGEVEPYETAHLNIEGTQNILRAARGARVVLASTCKAINPETAYGASKLIAERMVLNAGHSVARFYNIRESAGNVFEIWDAIPEDEQIPVTDCVRYFLFKDEALSLLLYAATAQPGLYTFKADHPQVMQKIAERLYGRDRVELVTRRRGDRYREPWKHEEEVAELVDGPINRLWNPHAGR